MLETSLVFNGATSLLLLLVALCSYLLLNNTRMRKKAERKQEFMESSRNAWASTIVDGRGVATPPRNTEEVEWLTEILLKYNNEYSDPVIRGRITELADTFCRDELASKLASRKVNERQYALAIVYQLGMTSLDAEVAAVEPETILDHALKAAILGEGIDVDALSGRQREDPSLARLDEILSGHAVQRGEISREY